MPSVYFDLINLDGSALTKLQTVVPLCHSLFLGQSQSGNVCIYNLWDLNPMIAFVGWARLNCEGNVMDLHWLPSKNLNFRVQGMRSFFGAGWISWVGSIPGEEASGPATTCICGNVLGIMELQGEATHQMYHVPTWKATGCNQTWHGKHPKFNAPNGKLGADGCHWSMIQSTSPKQPPAGSSVGIL